VRVEVTADVSQFAFASFVNVSKGKAIPVSGAASSSGGSSIPTGSSLNVGNITITDVVEDKSVTFKVTSAPAGARLAIWIDWNNRNGVLQGRQAGTIKVGSDGALHAMIKLPSAAVDRGRLRVRLQGLDGSTYLAYRWFINAENDSDTGSGAPATSSGGLPYVVVISVEEDESVKIKAFNFPKGDYVILMDEVGSGAKNGIEVDTVTIKAGRTFTGVFDIPDDLEGEDEIAIRVQNVDESSYYAYTWFEND
jgi:ribosomal protein L11